MLRPPALALLACGLHLVSCSSTQVDSGRRLKPDHAPTPYTADQIRRANPSGRIAVFLLEVPGRPEVHQIHRFADSSADGVTHESSLSTPEGTPIAEAKAARSTWKELQAHASFPRKATRISKGTITVPAGTFDCKLYTVTTMERGEKVTKRLHFADALPGPPIRFEQEVDGRVVFTMTLVRTEAPP